MAEIDGKTWISTSPSELYQRFNLDLHSLSINNQIYAMKILGDKGHSKKVVGILQELQNRDLDEYQRMKFNLVQASFYQRLSEFEEAHNYLISVQNLIYGDHRTIDQDYWRILYEKLSCSVATNHNKLDQAQNAIENLEQLFDVHPELKHYEEPEYWIIRSVMERKLRKKEWWSSIAKAVSCFERVDDIDFSGYASLYQAFIHNMEQNGDRAIVSYESAIDHFTSSENLIGQYKASNSLGLLYLRTGRYNDAINYLNQALPLAIKINSRHDQIKSKNYLSLAYENRGDYDIALAINHDTLTIVEKHEFNEYKGEILGKIGRIHDFRGEYDEAIDFFLKALDLHREHNNRVEFGYVLTLVGNVLLKQGQLDAAEQRFQESLGVFQEIRFDQPLAYAYGYLSIVNYYKGEIDVALEQINRSLEILERLDNIRNIAISKHTKAMILFSMGDTKRAISIMKQALEIKLKLDNEQLIATTVFYLVLFFTEIGEVSTAESYYDQLTELFQKTKDSIIEQQKILAQALILQSSSRASARFEGQKLLLGLIDTNILDFNLEVITMIHLIDQLVLEYQVTPDESILEETLVYLKRLSEISQTNSSFHLWVETLILESKLALVEGNLDHSYDQLLRARAIAKQHGLGTPLHKIEAEIKQLEKKYTRWEELIANNVSMKEKFEEAQIKSYMEAASKLFCKLTVE